MKRLSQQGFLDFDTKEEALKFINNSINNITDNRPKRPYYSLVYGEKIDIEIKTQKIAVIKEKESETT